MSDNSVEVHKMRHETWKVTMLYMGQRDMTGSRIAQAREYAGDESFMLAYRDGVSDVNIPALLDFHHSHGKAITMTSILPEGKFGVLNINLGNNQNQTYIKNLKDLIVLKRV